jgi:hypothetical protein
MPTITIKSVWPCDTLVTDYQTAQYHNPEYYSILLLLCTPQSHKMIALGPSLCAETVRNATVTEIRKWNVTDVLTNVSSDWCLNCSYSHINVSKKDKMTIMEDIHLVLYAQEVGGRPCGETVNFLQVQGTKKVLQWQQLLYMNCSKSCGCFMYIYIKKCLTSAKGANFCLCFKWQLFRSTALLS